MFRTGVNFIDGIAVEVTRKRIRRINLHVGRDGRVHLSVPFWGATIAEGEAFLRSKWKWVVETRARLLASPARAPVSSEMRVALGGLLGELHGRWSVVLGEPGVTWGVRAMKTVPVEAYTMSGVFVPIFLFSSGKARILNKTTCVYTPLLVSTWVFMQRHSPIGISIDVSNVVAVSEIWVSPLASFEMHLVSILTF